MNQDQLWLDYRISKPYDAKQIKNQFLRAFPNDNLRAETIEESAESTLSGFKSGIAMINLIGYFGMGSSAFAILTIQMMLVNSKTRELVLCEQLVPDAKTF